MSQGPVRNIIRVAQVLEAMAQGESRLSRMAEQLGLSLSSLHRVLKSMEAAGLAVQDPTDGGYYIGPRIFAVIADTLASHQMFISVARPVLQALGTELNETISIIIRSGDRKVVLDEIHGSDGVNFSVGRGFVSPMTFGATARVLLSQMADSDIEKVLAWSGQRHDAAALDDLRQRCREISFRGYDVSNGEYFEGARAVAVPLSGYVVPVAISALGSRERLNDERLPEVVSRLKAAAARIADLLAPILSTSEAGGRDAD